MSYIYHYTIRGSRFLDDRKLPKRTSLWHLIQNASQETNKQTSRKKKKGNKPITKESDG